MKRLLTLLAACIAAYAATAQSRIETFTFRSALLGAEKTCSVYLPAGYDDSGRSYPVLYLLHGASGYHGDWAEKGNMRQIADEAIAAGTALPMIVVMPEASGMTTIIGSAVPGWPYERFFFEEFVPAVERRYRICGDKARRAISGLSMGGGGTAVYALRHPELFGSACPMSGLLEAYGDPGENAFRRSVAENNPVQMVRDLSDAEAAAQRTLVGGLRRRRLPGPGQHPLLRGHAPARHPAAIPDARRRPHVALLADRTARHPRLRFGRLRRIDPVGKPPRKPGQSPRSGSG